ncbi:MAG: hypothetical protein HFJ57_02300 [Clostridia bacterium]|nr:hypothetical protein [Clostridia bacterium]
MYFYSEEMFNVTYSIDMIRLKTYISYQEFSEIEFRFNTCWADFVKNKYTSARLEQFFYNYNIEIEEGKSFWFGFMHNTERRSENITEYNFTIEFNPNKLKDTNILKYLFTFGSKWFLKSCDIACDIPVSILDIVYNKGRKRSTKVFSNGFDDKTIYIGKGDKRVKIYNKKIESNLAIKGDLTRIEVSKVFEDFPISNIKLFHIEDDIFPVLYMNKYIYSLKDYEDKTLLAIVYAIESGFDFNMLSRRYKEKVSQLLQGGNKISFSGKPATQVLRNVIFSCFSDIKCKVVFV